MRPVKFYPERTSRFYKIHNRKHTGPAPASSNLKFIHCLRDLCESHSACRWRGAKKNKSAELLPENVNHFASQSAQVWCSYQLVWFSKYSKFLQDFFSDKSQNFIAPKPKDGFFFINSVHNILYSRLAINWPIHQPISTSHIIQSKLFCPWIMSVLFPTIWTFFSDRNREMTHMISVWLQVQIERHGVPLLPMWTLLYHRQLPHVSVLCNAIIMWWRLHPLWHACSTIMAEYTGYVKFHSMASQGYSEFTRVPFFKVDLLSWR